MHQNIRQHVPYKHIDLTDEGRRKGLELCKRQEIITTYLMSTLLVDRATAFKEACKLEHVISPEIIVKMNERQEAVR